MKFKDFQAPVLFSSTFKALNLGEKKIQVLSRTFKDAWEPFIEVLDYAAKKSHVTEMRRCGLLPNYFGQQTVIIVTQICIVQCFHLPARNAKIRSLVG